MITEKSNQLQVIMITDYDYPISGQGVGVRDILTQQLTFLV